MTFRENDRGLYHESNLPTNIELSRIAVSFPDAATAPIQNKKHRVQFEPERVVKQLQKDELAWRSIGEAMHCIADRKRRLETEKRRIAAATYMREYRARKKRQLHAPSDEGGGVEKAKAAAYMREYRARKKRPWDASSSQSTAKKNEAAKFPKDYASVPNGEQPTRPASAKESLTTNETQSFGENKIYSKHEQPLMVKQEFDDDQVSVNSFNNQRDNDDDNEDLDEETDQHEEKLNDSILARIEQHQQLENLNYSTPVDRTKLERSYLLECPAESLQHFLREDKETMTLSSTQPENSSSNNGRDECSVYGEHVANELRYMPFRTRTIVKHIINNAIFNAHMGKYDRERSAEELLADDQFRAE